jgi:hypothetical protein
MARSGAIESDGQAAIFVSSSTLAFRAASKALMFGYKTIGSVAGARTARPPVLNRECTPMNAQMVPGSATPAGLFFCSRTAKSFASIGVHSRLAIWVAAFPRWEIRG